LTDDQILSGMHRKETGLGFDDQSWKCFFVRQIFINPGSDRILIMSLQGALFISRSSLPI